MEKIFDDIINFLIPLSDIYLYIFLFLSAVIENLFPPIPGDTITAFGAFLVGTGRLNYFLVYICTTLGSVLGFMLLFFGGRLLEREFFMKKNFRFFSAESIVAAEEWFGRWGYLVVLANRFFPGIRSVISIVSGITQLNVIKVFILSLLSASVWNFIWIHVGFLLGNNWSVVKEKLGGILRNYNITVGIILAVMLAGYGIYYILRKRKLSNS